MFLTQYKTDDEYTWRKTTKITSGSCAIFCVDAAVQCYSNRSPVRSMLMTIRDRVVKYEKAIVLAMRSSGGTSIVRRDPLPHFRSTFRKRVKCVESSISDIFTCLNHMSVVIESIRKIPNGSFVSDMLFQLVSVAKNRGWKLCDVDGYLNYTTCILDQDVNTNRSLRTLKRLMRRYHWEVFELELNLT